MLYVIPDTLLKVSLSTKKTGHHVLCYTLFNATFNNVSYSVEHGDQFYWCLTPLSTMLVIAQNMVTSFIGV
jgi:hypothetical protein